MNVSSSVVVKGHGFQCPSCGAPADVVTLYGEPKRRIVWTPCGHESRPEDLLE